MASTRMVRLPLLGGALLGAMVLLVVAPQRLGAVVKATPSVGVYVHDAMHDKGTAFPWDTDVHPFIRVLSHVGVPTGQVHARWWPNGTCSGAGITSADFQLVGSQVDTTFERPGGNPGTYSFRSFYDGDANTNAGASICVAYTIQKAPITLVTKFHNNLDAVVTSVRLEVGVHVFATLSGPLGPPTGVLELRRFVLSGCFLQAEVVFGPADEMVDGVANFRYGPSFPSSQWWQVTYLGNSDYKAVVGPCMKIRWRQRPEIGLTVHNPAHSAVGTVAPGTTVHLRATVSGDFGDPTGSVTLAWHANGSCSGGKTLGTATLAAGVAHDPGLDRTLSTPGTYSFRATYGGDEEYTPLTSACIAVTVTASPTAPPPAATATPAPNPSAGPTEPPPTQAPSETVGPVDSAAPVATASSEPSSVAGGTPPASPVAPDPASGEVGLGMPLLVVVVLGVLAIGFIAGRWRRTPWASGKPGGGDP